MSKDKNDWNAPVSHEHRTELDQELIKNLNANDEHYHEPRRKRRTVIKVVGIVTVLVYLVFILNHLFAIFSLPSLDFIDKSRVLLQDEQIQVLRDAVVEVSVGNSRGTGFNIDESGLIVTNHHVVDHTGMITTRFPQGSPYGGRVVASFPEVDLALIRIEGVNLPVIEMAADTEPKIGDAVTIIGNPLWYSHIVTEGKIMGETMLVDWDVPVMQIRAPIHRGSSGSPVIDDTGKVIAVIFATSTAETTGGDTIGYAVPIRHIYDEGMQ